jgi:hypothetical protein
VFFSTFSDPKDYIYGVHITFRLERINEEKKILRFENGVQWIMNYDYDEIIMNTMNCYHDTINNN